MAVRKSEAVWQGTLKEGNGTMRLGSGAYQGAYSFSSRFEEGVGTNPEELIAAAHAGCFSMAFSGNLTKAGFTPEQIHTVASVSLGAIDGKSRITGIHLECEAKVEGVREEAFQEMAEAAKSGCPVSVALSNVPMTLNAKLISS
ncbi:MAG: OsmC family protein [Anaerolineaceae bacterium]|nr:OsmC family protein [Anaerolineaceae bacterium]